MRSGPTRPLFVLFVLLGLPGVALGAAKLPINTDSEPAVSATLLAAELTVRMPGRLVRPVGAAGPSARAYAVVVRSPTAPPGPMTRLTLEVRAPDGQLIARHALRYAAEPQTAREIAVLAEGAIRLHQQRLDDLLRRVASDVPRLSLSAQLGARLLLEEPRLGPVINLALRVRLWRRLVGALELHGGLPLGGEGAGVDYDVTLLSLRVALAYALPFYRFVASVGSGVEVQLVHGRFAPPSGDDRVTNDVYGAPFATADLEWPRDRRLRLVATALLSYALSHPEYRWTDRPVVRLGAWAAELVLGVRWAF